MVALTLAGNVGDKTEGSAAEAPGANGVPNVNATTSVQPTWFRVKTAGGVAVLDGSAGTSASDMIIGVPTAGQPVAITAWTITSGNAGH